MLRLLTVLLVLAIDRAVSQDANCNFYQNVQAGQVYHVYSPNYSNNYPAGVQCRWIAVCPTGYNCRLDCYEVSLPQSTSCSMDRLLISKSGDPQLTSADYYCGAGTVSAVSTGQQISIGLISSYNSPGGRFRCELTAQPATPVSTCSCGYKKTNRIVNGVETGINEFPMMVGIADTRIFQIKCGAVIIGRRHVLTAGHCLDNLTPNIVGVVVGEHNINTGQDTSATAVYRVSSFLRHPSYNDANYDYDIAILTLTEDIQFSDRVGPVCLPFKFVNANMTGTKVTALGWGTQFSGGPTSNVLMKVDLDVISRSSCVAMKNSAVTARQFCTYTLGKDACQDDSGGPLLYTDPSTGLLFNLGIISHGQFCANRNNPGLNTDVPSLLNWIVANTPGENYCRK